MKRLSFLRRCGAGLFGLVAWPANLLAEHFPRLAPGLPHALLSCKYDGEVTVAVVRLGGTSIALSGTPHFAGPVEKLRALATEIERRQFAQMNHVECPYCGGAATVPPMLGRPDRPCPMCMVDPVDRDGTDTGLEASETASRMSRESPRERLPHVPRYGEAGRVPRGIADPAWLGAENS